MDIHDALIFIALWKCSYSELMLTEEENSNRLVGYQFFSVLAYNDYTQGVKTLLIV